jgi:16S rRNA (guanine527-N7)-methyltransferase
MPNQPPNPPTPRSPRTPRPPSPPIDPAQLPRAIPATAEFLAAAADLGVEFEPADLLQLEKFLDLLLKANATTNLTAITDPAAAWMKHIFDAMTLVPIIASMESTDGKRLRVVDIGSGGGVPALPLAIVLPDVDFTLVEATGKKVTFLRETAAALGLKNVVVLQDRAERIGQDHKSHRERYDASTARALGHLAVVAELAGPLVRQGGFVLAVKGAKAEQELEESAKALGQIGLRHTETVTTPTGRIVVMEKTIRTPRSYPRKDGEPARAPIGIDSKGSPKSSPPQAD